MVANTEAIATARRGYASTQPAEPGNRDPAARRYYLSEEHAAELFGLDEDDPHDMGRTYDPWTYYRTGADLRLYIEFDEYPGGGFELHTNSAGLKDDELDYDTARDLRVLVAGDSHTFGVCAPEMNYSNQLERRLAEEWPGRSFDVLNAGQGGFTFYHYLGTLEKFLDWRPDVFVLGVFAGNDFSELIGLANVFDEGEASYIPRPAIEARRRLMRTSRAAIGQCYNGALVFKHRPDHREPIVARAVDLVAQMKALCDAHGVHFVVALIPTPCEFEWAPAVPQFRRAKAVLELTPEDCALTNLLGQRFLIGVRGLELATIDMTARFHSLDQPPYWRKDQHLNLDGHAELAEALLGELADWSVASGRLPAR